MLYTAQKSCVFSSANRIPGYTGKHRQSWRISSEFSVNFPQIPGKFPANGIRCYTGKVRLRGLKKEGN